jgi:hypothetical protein
MSRYRQEPDEDDEDVWAALAEEAIRRERLRRRLVHPLQVDPPPDDDDIDTSDIPELDASFFEGATLTLPGEPLIGADDDDDNL